MGVAHPDVNLPFRFIGLPLRFVDLHHHCLGESLPDFIHAEAVLEGVELPCLGVGLRFIASRSGSSRFPLPLPRRIALHLQMPNLIALSTRLVLLRTVRLYVPLLAAALTLDIAFAFVFVV